MNNRTTLSVSPEQPWWYVRLQLVVTLLALAVICLSLWVDGPVRSWVSKAVVGAEFPAITLVAMNAK